MAFKTVTSAAKTIVDITDSYSVFLSNEAVVVACDESGTPVAGQLGATGTTVTTIQVYKGTIPLTAVAVGSTPAVGQFKYVIGTTTGGTSARKDDKTFYVSAISADSGSVPITVYLEDGVTTIVKALSFGRAKTGATGPQGESGFLLNWTTQNVEIDNQGRLRKTLNSTNWDAQAYSMEAYKDGAFLTFKVNQSTQNIMIGLNTDPALDANYTSLDYAFYLRSDANVGIYESNVTRGNFGGVYAKGDTFAMTYDNTKVCYYRNGTLLREIAAQSGLKFYVDSSFGATSATVQIYDLYFSPMASKGETGAKGDTGPAGQLNLVTNPHITATNAGWAGTAAYGTTAFVDGRTIGVNTILSTSDSMATATTFDIEPQKMYEFSVWLKQSVTKVGNYVGLYVYNKAGVNIGLYKAARATGVVETTLSTNAYFASNVSITAETWVKYVAYIIPAGFDTTNVEFVKNLGENVSHVAKFPSDAAKATMRILNYANTALAPSTLTFAMPLVQEVDISALETNRAANEARRLGGFGADLINLNPVFMDWSGATPEGYSTTVTGGGLTKVTSTNGTGNAARFAVNAATNHFLTPNMVTTAPYFQYLTVEATFMLQTGTIDGAGLLIRYEATTDVDVLIPFKSLVPSPVLGKWYTVTKVIKQPLAAIPAGFLGYSIFPKAGYTGFGTVTAKSIQFDSIRVAPSSEQEINTFEVTVIENGVTVIDGGRIKTNSVLAESIDARRLSVKNASGVQTFLIDASGEVTVNGKVSVNGSSVFAAGYDPSQMQGGRNISVNSRFATSDISFWAHWGVATRTVETITDLPGFTRAVKLVTTANSQGISQTVPVIAGTTYTASLYVKSTVGQGVLQIQNGAAFPFAAQPSNTIALNQWRRIKITFTATASTAQIQVGNGGVGMGTAGTYWFTGIQLEEGDKMTGWSPAFDDIDLLLDKVVTPNGEIRATDIATSLSITPGAVDIIGQYISLKGKVTFSDFATGWAVDDAGMKISNSDQPGYDPTNILYLDLDGNYRPLSDEENFMGGMFTKPEGANQTMIDGGRIQAQTILAKDAIFNGLEIITKPKEEMINGVLTTVGNEVKTFVVGSNGEIEMAGTAKSINFEEGKSGWQITADGNSEFNEAKFRGDVQLGYYDTTIEAFVATGGLLSTVSSEGKDLRFWAGTDQDNAGFKVFSDGTLQAKKGEFEGAFTGEINIGSIRIADDPLIEADASLRITNAAGYTKVLLSETLNEFNAPTVFGNEAGEFMKVDSDAKKLLFGTAGDLYIDYANNLLQLKGFSMKGTTALEFISEGSSGEDFIFKNSTGDTTVRVDGSFAARDDIEISDVVRMRKSVELNNKGVDFVFI